MEKRQLKRYRLDVSAQFYPIISTKRAQSLFRLLFRLSAVMEREVDAETLRRAAEDVLLRFPTFKVRLRRGYAWYYFEENDAPVKVFPSTGRLLAPIDPKETGGYLFRISKAGRVIEFDVFHAVCDGMAALEFLKALVWRYAVRPSMGTTASSTSPSPRRKRRRRTPSTATTVPSVSATSTSKD